MIIPLKHKNLTQNIEIYPKTQKYAQNLQSGGNPPNTPKSQKYTQKSENIPKNWKYT